MGLFFGRRNAVVEAALATPAAASVAPSQVRETSTTSAPVPPARPDATDVVTVDSALSIAAVYRAVSVIVTSVSQMPLTVFRGGTEMRTIPALVRTPNVNDTQSGFVEETVFSLATSGQAFWRLYRANSTVPPDSIKVLDPNLVAYDEDLMTGVVTYYYNGQRLEPWQIKHLRLLRRPGTVRSLGPIQAARGEISALLKLRAFADTWFDTSGVPLGYLTTDLILSPDESAAFATAWKKFLADNGGIGVLSQGLDYKYVGANPEQAQFLGVQQAAVTNIARLFGLPAFYLLAAVEGSSMTYTNMESANLSFLQTTLSRYMNEIENALTDLTVRGQVVRFKDEALLRLDATTLWNVRKVQSDLGYTSGAELRQIDGKEPLADALAPASDEDVQQ